MIKGNSRPAIEAMLRAFKSQTGNTLVLHKSQVSRLKELDVDPSLYLQIRKLPVNEHSSNT